MEYPVDSCIWKLFVSGSMADRYAYSRGVDVEEKMPCDAVGRYYRGGSRQPVILIGEEYEFI